MRMLLHVLPLLALFAAGCGDSTPPAKPAPADQAAPAEEPAAQPQLETVLDAAAGEVHEVICGCALEEVGHCGEYIKVGDQYLELAGDLGLGPMPFCQKDGLKARVTGEVKDGKYHVASFALVE
ncbi:MAG: hypothetical protein HY812_16365 [Planctomycetes bacterium]|nr:hypothetical protein [Planctomycetota bacterium]